MWTGRIWGPHHVQFTMWCMHNVCFKRLSNISYICGFIAILVLKGNFCCLNICQQLAGGNNSINSKIPWIYDWIYDFISHHQEFCYKQEQIPFPIISSPSLRKGALPLVCCNSPMPCQICKAIINPLQLVSLLLFSITRQAQSNWNVSVNLALNHISFFLFRVVFLSCAK